MNRRRVSGDVGSGFSRIVESMGALAAVIAVFVLAAAPLAGQAPRNTVKKTPVGDPDLQGVYTFSSLTPLQRPGALAAKVALTEVELAAQQERDAATR